MNEELGAVIGRAARAAREQMGLTQAQVAARIGLSTLVYSRMERGKMLPSVPSLVRLCAALHLSPEVALGFAPRKAGAPRSQEEKTLQRLVYIARDLDRDQLDALLAVATTMRR